MNKIAIASVGLLLIVAALTLRAEQGCMARRDYGRSLQCWLLRGVVETLAPQTR
jgi:hypothetical protein